MIKFLLFPLLLFLSSPLLSGYELYLSPSADRGTIAQAVIYPVKGSSQVTFFLHSTDQKLITQSRGFRFRDKSTNKSFIIGLLGIASNIEPGYYRLTAKVSEGRKSYEIMKELYVNQVEFKTTQINLNKMLTALHTEPDPEKEEQSRRLWAILKNFNERGVYASDKLLFPLYIRYRESSSFGNRRIYNYSDGKKSENIHWGSDFAAPTGTEILAPAEGRVVLAENRKLTGWSLVLEHLPGVYTLYYHMDSINVNVGQIVRKGRKIGEVGTTGFSTGPHLHWELRVNTVAVDIKKYAMEPLIDKKMLKNIIENR